MTKPIEHMNALELLALTLDLFEENGPDKEETMLLINARYEELQHQFNMANRPIEFYESEGDTPPDAV